MEYKALHEHLDKIADVPGDGDDHHRNKSVMQGKYEVDHGVSDLETSQFLESEVEKRVTARSIASKVSVANITQNVFSSHGSSCTGDGYAAIQKHYDELLGAFASMGMLEVTAKAYAKGLITPEIRDSIFSGKCAEFKKANVLLSAVQEKIKTDPSAFDTFIKILRSERAYEPLADMVTESGEHLERTTMEYKALHEHFDKTVDIFSSSLEPHSLADRLYSARLINESAVEEASEASVEKMVRIKRLMSAVQTQVERDPSNYYHFVSLTEDLPEALNLLKVTKTLLPSVAFAEPILTKTFGSSGGIFEIKKAGVTIRIPPGAISSDAIATVSIKICSEGPFQFPKDCKVVSSVCLFETNLKLVKPVEIVVSHFDQLLSKRVLTSSLVPDYRGPAPFYLFQKVACDDFETETIGKFVVPELGVFAAVGQILETAQTTVAKEDRPKLAELATVPIESAQWYTLGLALGLEEDVLNSIEVDQSNKHPKCKRAVFRKWLESNPTASWNEFLKALVQIGEEELAEKVRNEFSPQPSGSAHLPDDGNHGDDHHSNNSEGPAEDEVDHGISVMTELLNAVLSGDALNTDSILRSARIGVDERLKDADLPPEGETTVGMLLAGDNSPGSGGRKLTSTSSDSQSSGTSKTSKISRDDETSLPRQQAVPSRSSPVGEATSLEEEDTGSSMRAQAQQDDKKAQVHSAPLGTPTFEEQHASSIKVQSIYSIHQPDEPPPSTGEQKSVQSFEGRVKTAPIASVIPLETPFFPSSSQVDPSKHSLRETVASAMQQKTRVEPDSPLCETVAAAMQQKTRVEPDSPLHETVAAVMQQKTRVEPDSPLHETEIKTESSRGLSKSRLTPSSSEEIFHSFSGDEGVEPFPALYSSVTSSELAMLYSSEWKLSSLASPLTATLTTGVSGGGESGGGLGSGQTLSPSSLSSKINTAKTELLNAVLSGDALHADSVLRSARVGVDERLKDGRTALMLAAISGRSEMVKLLLHLHKATVDEKDPDGRTALHLAASYGNYEIVKILVSACANVDTTTIKVKKWTLLPSDFSIHGGELGTHLSKYSIMQAEEECLPLMFREEACKRFANLQCQDLDLLHISRMIERECNSLASVGACLLIGREVISEIEKDESCPKLNDKIHNVLLQWQIKNTSNATWASLIKSLEVLDEQKLMEHIQTYLSQKEYPVKVIHSEESEAQTESKDRPGTIDSDMLPEQIKSQNAGSETLKRQLGQEKPKSSHNSFRGVGVVGEKALVVTNEAMNLQLIDYGFKLHVPENALPEGVPEYSVNIKISLAGQFELPEGYELVSAVYWVKTPGKFTKPLTIEVQHCANFRNPNQLCFVRTSCTQKTLPYKFKIIDGGSFTLGNRYGALSTTNFSGLAIVRAVTPNEQSCQYCAQVYFTVKNLRNYWYYCHFVVTKNLEICLTVLKKRYQQEYDIAPAITFDGDQVALDISADGTKVNEWEIVPVHRAVIKKDQVDNFSPENTWVPACVLLLKWLQKDKAPDPLEYKVKLNGLGADSDFFRIVYDPDTESQSYPLASTLKIQAAQGGAEDSPAERPQVELKSDQKPTLLQLLSFPGKSEQINIPERIGTHCKTFGIFLLKDENGAKVESIAKEESTMTDMNLKILSKWLQGQGIQPPTWNTVIKVLRQSNNLALAEEIASVITP